MDTLTKPKTSFKAILLAKDEERMAQIIKDHKKTAEKLNEALGVALAFIEKDIDDQAKEDLLMGGFPKAMAMIRLDFQFPKADDAFNLKSMGKDPAPVETALESVPAWYSKEIFQVSEGTVELAEGLTTKVDQECSTYTQNDKQNELYEIASGVCENLNKANASGFIGRLDTGDIERGLKLVRWDSIEQKFYPNPSFIKKIGPDGGIRSMY